MDYVVGGVAALLTGNVTPSRPKLLRKALTPTKHQSSPNVTPKSELVDDRSMFMSPTLQKKKAVLKKSPKRIFQNPDLDLTNDGEGISALTSPKAEKVKKHLKNELEGDSMITTALLSPKSPKSNKIKQLKSMESVLGTPSKKSKKNILARSELQESAKKNENTMKEKIRESINEIFSDKENDTEVTVTESSKKSKKKQKLISESNDSAKNTSLATEAADNIAELSPKKRKKNNTEIKKEDSTEKPIVTKNNKISKAKRRRERKKAIKTKLIKLGKLAAPDETLRNVNPKKSNNKIIKSSTINNDKESDDDDLNDEAIEAPTKVKKNKHKTKKNHEKITENGSNSENESDNQETSKTSNQEETRKNKKHKLVKKQPINSQDSDSEDDTKLEEESIKPDKIKNKSVQIEMEDSGNDANMEEEEPKPKKKKKKTKSAKIETLSELYSELHESLELIKPDKKVKKNKPTKIKNPKNTDSDSDSVTQKSLESLPVKKTKTKVNPNAVTDQNTDSEHESDDEIESENEQINEKIFTTEQSQENLSSDEEQEHKQETRDKSQKKQKQPAENKTDIDNPEVIKRTLFVGNVPFSKKCKKEIKSLFSKYGQIETVRIRTVPVKDGRVTPKMAVIKNELHPDRTTVNVYVKFTDSDSVEKALSANNTVLNEHHLRVSRSDQSGAHDSSHAVFVGNLPFAIEDEGLRAVFDKCGEINSVRIVRDRATNAGKGFGYVNFASRDGVELALSLSEEDLTIKNRIIRVKRCTQSQQKHKNQGNQSQRDNRKFQGNVQGRAQGGRSQDGNQGNSRFQDRKQGGNFQSRNQGGNFQQRSQGGNFQQRNKGGKFQQTNEGGGFRERSDDGKARGQGNRQRQGDNDTQFEGAIRRLNKKRQIQEVTDGPANKIPKSDSSVIKEKKTKKEFVGMTADKKKKHKCDKGLKKKKKLSEILMKKNVDA